MARYQVIDRSPVPCGGKYALDYFIDCMRRTARYRKLRISIVDSDYQTSFL